jgi:hypothetical protein
LTRRGFDRVFNEWKKSQHEFDTLGEDLYALGRNSERIIARRCAKLTEREAIAVLKALSYEGVGYDTSDNRIWAVVQRQFGRWTLASMTRKLVLLAPACCTLDRGEGYPYPEMATALNWSREQIETVGQGLREELFGLSTRRRNTMLGHAVSLLSGSEIPDKDREWFGANWKSVLTVWDMLRNEDSVNRSRAEALISGASSDVPPVLLDGAL